MKITPNILSIPPYLSTSWDNILSMHAQKQDAALQLTVILKDGTKTAVPNLDEASVRAIFEAHTHYAENPKNQPETSLMSFPLKLDGSLVEHFASSLQHNQELANLPPLPEEVLKKITAFAQSMGTEDFSALSKPEPHCNCVYCQVARALTGLEEEEEELVLDEDLRFKEWEIEQTSEKLYSLTNPLDTAEHYNVFLGNPIGCTCGKKNCEHIRAVLST